MVNVQPLWIFVAGIVMLFVFLVAFAFRAPVQRLGPGGTRRYAPHLLGPGGTYHPYEGFASGGSAEPTTLYMVGVDWCPHCQSAKPGFISLGSTTTIDGHPVSFQYLDGEKDKDRLPPCEIGGYPTFCFQHKGRNSKYSGPRSVEGYMSFVKEQLRSA